MAVAACPAANQEAEPLGLEQLLACIAEHTPVPHRCCACAACCAVCSCAACCAHSVCCRAVDAPFLFSVDHCFSVKGHGTVITGTVLSGAVQAAPALCAVLRL